MAKAIGDYVVVMKVEVIANCALEGQIVRLELMFFLLAVRHYQSFSWIHFFLLTQEQPVEGFGTGVKVVPDIRNFCDGPKDRAPELINVVWKGIGALNEFGLGFVVDFQLDLADNKVVELDVDEDVIGSFP